MSFDENTEDSQVDLALRNFRASVHAWSDAELSRPRSIQRSPVASFWRAVANPVMAYALAGALMFGGACAPIAVMHHRHVAAAQQAALAAQKRQAAEAAEREAKLAMDDEELLNHVDSDIAQATPDAMEPLANMMRDTTAR